LKQIFKKEDIFHISLVSWDSAGTSRFKGPKRGTRYAAQISTKNAICMLGKSGMIEAQLMIKGAGPGRDAALRTVLRSGSGVKVKCIRDETPFPHNFRINVRMNSFSFFDLRTKKGFNMVKRKVIYSLYFRIIKEKIFWRFSNAYSQTFCLHNSYILCYSLFLDSKIRYNLYI